MTSNKNNKYTKDQRRQRELLKAQSKTYIRGSEEDQIVSSNKVFSQPGIEKRFNSLNLNIIRRDLLKTGLYVVFVLVAIIFIKKFNLESYLRFYK